MSITFKRRLKPRDFLNRENSIKRVLNHSTRFKYRNLSCQGHVTNCWLTRRTAPIMWCHHQKPTWLSKITKNRMGWMKARVRSRVNWKLHDRRYCDDSSIKLSLNRPMKQRSSSRSNLKVKRPFQISEKLTFDLQIWPWTWPLFHGVIKTQLIYYWRSLKLYDPITIEVHYSRSLTFTDDPLSRQTVWLILSKYFIKTVERMFVIMITSWLFFALVDSCQ